MRYRLDDPESRRFPFFDEMRSEGVTDYIAVPLLFTDGTIHASSWTTRNKGGFTDDHLAALRSVIPPLSRRRRDRQQIHRHIDSATAGQSGLDSRSEHIKALADASLKWLGTDVGQPHNRGNRRSGCRNVCVISWTGQKVRMIAVCMRTSSAGTISLCTA
ncbi:hypothetical protein [Bradyrhizobium commune]|uniref:GAF domain-containing protein n=1 Tax=Bradyrhizobium commune TaxID=83627 RepID=A0A7S9D8I9_9BRAD|nr:hypothetical protein [Bradyrhizobium commune]QPF92973.1 hypothetical protein IC761_06740 [Bradyrhizobium commune]